MCTGYLLHLISCHLKYIRTVSKREFQQRNCQGRKLLAKGHEVFDDPQIIQYLCIWTQWLKTQKVSHGLLTQGWQILCLKPAHHLFWHVHFVCTFTYCPGLLLRTTAEMVTTVQTARFTNPPVFIDTS